MFVTDIKGNEVQIIEPNCMDTLFFKNLDGDVRTSVIPTLPWTHEILASLDLCALLGDDYLLVGYDAYLGHDWVGSTEV